MPGLNWVRCHEQVRARRFWERAPAANFNGSPSSGPHKAIHFQTRRATDLKNAAFEELQSYIAAFDARKAGRNFRGAREIAAATAKVIRHCERFGPDFTSAEDELLRLARTRVGAGAGWTSNSSFEPAVRHRWV